MNLSFEDSDSPPASPQKPMLNYRRRLSVDGPVLGILADLTSKVEKALEETTNEIESKSKLTKYLAGENRQFVKALYDLEHFIGTTAERSRSNEPFFGSIDPSRTKTAWKQVCQALRHLSLALLRMTQECGMLKSIQVCRRYVVRVLRRIAFHFGESLQSFLADEQSLTFASRSLLVRWKARLDGFGLGLFDTETI
jgi:hypothetical protein